MTSAPDAAAVVGWLRNRGERADQIYRVPVDAGDVAAEHGCAG